MKTIATVLAALPLVLAATIAQAEPTKDCLLEGTVVKSGAEGNGQGTNVKFHSMEKYDEDANCRVRRGEKVEFKLPEDTRVQQAPEGSTVKYRYKQEQDGSTSTELLSVGT